ncbi:hypothetical protein [Acetobacterium woodii]|nr:hypothetical protein [Acetobacterium woodii]
MKKTYSTEEQLEELKLITEVKARAASDQLGIKLDTLSTLISKSQKDKPGSTKEPTNILHLKQPESLARDPPLLHT